MPRGYDSLSPLCDMQPTMATPADASNSSFDQFPSSWTAESITLEYIKHLEAKYPNHERPARLRELRFAIVNASTYQPLQSRTRTLNSQWPCDSAQSYGSCERVEGLPFVGKWPFPPTVAEYLILQAELSLKGMALAIRITEDRARFGDIADSNFVVISRDTYSRELFDKEAARNATPASGGGYVLVKRQVWDVRIGE